MKKLIITLIIIHIFQFDTLSQIAYLEDSIEVTSVNSGSGWYSIKFTSDSIGYLRNGVDIFKTTDGGENWNRILNEDIKNVQFISNDLIIANVYDGIKRSTDGGTSWKWLNRPNLKEDPRGFVNLGTVKFINDTLGLTYDEVSPVKLYLTKNEGLTWKEVFSNDKKLTSFHFIDENIGFVIMDDSLLTTTDGGQTWNFEISKKDPEFYDQFHFLGAFDTGNTFIFTSIDQDPVYVPKPDTLLKNENSYFANGGAIMALSRNTSGNIAMLVKEVKNNDEMLYLHLYYYNTTNSEWSKVKRIFPETNAYSISLTDNNTVFLSNGTENLIRKFEFSNFLFIPEICYVEPNENDQLTIHWPSNEFKDVIVRYNVYKKVTTNSYNQIGYSMDLSFTDTLSKSISSSEEYKISTTFVDSIESILSNQHSSILLQAGVGLNNEVLLVWNQYIGLDYDQIQIWRGPNSSELELITTLPADNFRYTDLNSNENERLYQIRFEFESLCDVSSGGRTNNLSVLKSNYVDLRKTILGTEVSNPIKIYPNPSDSYLHLEGMDRANYQIINLSGIKVKEGIVTNNQISITDLKSGQYIVNLKGQNFRFIKTNSNKH